MPDREIPIVRQVDCAGASCVECRELRELVAYANVAHGTRAITDQEHRERLEVLCSLYRGHQAAPDVPPPA